MNVAQILSTLAVLGLATLRENLVLARLVNRQYESAITGATRGSTINIVVPSAVVAVNVTPAAVPPATAATTPSVVPITLTEWMEAPFTLTDFDLARVQRGVIPMEAAEAVKALANAIEAFLWTKATFYGFAGTPGTTPFATDLSAYLSARNIANKQLVPMDPRFMIINPDAEANALGLRAFQDASFRGDTDGIINGQIGRKLGALWIMSQLVPTQDDGTQNGAYVTNGVQALGVKALNIKTGAGTIAAGAIFTIAGDTQTYAVQAAANAGGTQTISIEPGLKVATTDGLAITFKNPFAKNLLVHRDGLGFAMAPLMETVISDKLVDMQPITDAESGLSIRVELTREHKRWRWSFDAMWGATLVRPEFGVNVAG
jgi:hypothetical protein